MRIVTLTLNPAYDVHCAAPGFLPDHETTVDVLSRDAGGKGVNIARALAADGVPVTAVVAVGEENGGDFAAALRRDGLDVRLLSVPGRIRENITLHTGAGRETRISFRGFAVGPDFLSALSDLLSDLGDGDILTLTGSTPTGLAPADLAPLLSDLRRRGVRLVIDSRSYTLADLTAAAPFLVKPNEEEIAQYTGGAVADRAAAKIAAVSLRAAGIENVMISLGARGALLACPTGVFFSPAPAIAPRSTIGAGDSSIAGFLAALSRGADAAACLRTAVAFGSAACLTDGTRPPRAQDIRRLLSGME